MVVQKSLMVTYKVNKSYFNDIIIFVFFFFFLIGMFSYLAFSTKKIRLYVIDYAGLLTDPNDIQRALK
jgi:hypothetical protein